MKATRDRNNVAQQKTRSGTVLFNCDNDIRNRLRKVSELTGISQRRILEGATTESVVELEKQIALGGPVGLFKGEN